MSMIQKKLIVCDGPLPESIRPNANVEVLTHAEFAARARNGYWLKRIRAYQDVGTIVPHLWLRSRPLLFVAVLRSLSRGSCWLMDGEGNRTGIDVLLVLRRALALLMEGAKIPFLLQGIRAEVDSLTIWAKSHQSARLRGDGPPLYLKTDLWFAPQIGGSVTHMAGVVNHLHEVLGHPLVFSTAPNPLLSEDIDWKLILPEPQYWDFREIPALVFSRTANRDVRAGLGGRLPSFIYQRYSLNNYAGVLLARDLAIPLVTEYNGSEVWISKNWGKPAALGDLSARIEMLNLHASDLVVVVSRVLRDELLERGVVARKILVNPNGVDVNFFHPGIDSSELRKSLGIAGKIVIGFIGTFGPWHGAEVLVQAVAVFLKSNPLYRDRLHLLMVGDGVRHAAARRLSDQLGIAANCSFSGLVPQRDGPKCLACCDILVAPHVPNVDGSEFFGSPTKLFEYMAMGRPIVASRLGQISEVIEHGRTGWLVDPGSPEALAEGLSTLLQNDRLRAMLGSAAREEAVQKYSWRTHVERVAVALKDLCA